MPASTSCRVETTNCAPACKAGSYALAAMGALVLFAIILLTFADVAGRYLFAAPVPGAFQLTRIGLAIFVFAGLPAVTFHREQLTVGLFEDHFPDWMKRVLDRLIAPASALTLGFFAWTMWRQSLYFGENREVVDRIQLPLSVLAYFICAMALVATVIAVVNLFVPPPAAGPIKAVKDPPK